MNNPPWCVSITTMNKTIQQVPSDTRAPVKVKVTIKSNTYAHVVDRCKVDGYPTPAQYIQELVRKDYCRHQAPQHA